LKDAFFNAGLPLHVVPYCVIPSRTGADNAPGGIIQVRARIHYPHNSVMSLRLRWDFLDCPSCVCTSPSFLPFSTRHSSYDISYFYSTFLLSTFHLLQYPNHTASNTITLSSPIFSIPSRHCKHPLFINTMTPHSLNTNNPFSLNFPPPFVCTPGRPQCEIQGSNRQGRGEGHR
jgi:hypothetical protein